MSSLNSYKKYGILSAVIILLVIIVLGLLGDDVEELASTALTIVCPLAVIELMILNALDNGDDE